MSITQARARQIIKEEVARALRGRRLSEMGGMHGHMEDAAYEGAEEGDVYEFDAAALEGDYGMEEDDMMETEDDSMMEMEDEDMMEMDDDMGNMYDGDMGHGDDALMETLRRRLLGRRTRR